VEAVNAPSKKSSAVALAKAYRRLGDHPVGGLLVEDLAASREHGLVTARVGIAPDGNPIVYARDEAVAKRIGEAMQNQTAVHVRPIPPLDVREFKLLSRQADRALGPGPTVEREQPSGISLDDYRGAVECALVGAFSVERTQAVALVERHASGVEKGHREGVHPEAVARAIHERRAGGRSPKA
jgi:hypothetical protein